ncbi:MAG TPA: DEAD/DEAH box helicase family protein [Candidatus Absconditabacterales bacterium]|nr:DEAD/DEAH box helicase family protein [Candidatus Absconditabacterales bacterium]
MQFFLNALQSKIQARKEQGYEGVYPETSNILKYIHKVNFLRQPQKEALESYIYLKEVCKNKPLNEIVFDILPFKELIKELKYSSDEVLDLMELSEQDKRKKIAEKIGSSFGNDDYTNQVYALTMGTGKTVLMTAFMLYDIVLSYYHPESPLFAKNFLVFAPDKTIIQSLKEIKSFDERNIIPPEYQNALLQIKYHYLEDTKHTIAVSEGSVYNVIVTNSQKIIVKTRKGNQGDLKNSLLGDPKAREQHEIENQRLISLKKLENLSVFIDEAHHSFGMTLEGEIKKTKDAINRIHENKSLINCINMTGTPYVEGKMISNVVYYFGLKEGIQDGILKEAEIIEFGEVKSDDFLTLVISEFWQRYGEERFENKLPKIAIYTANIEELKEVRQKLEKEILKEMGIGSNKVIENHSEVSNEELKEFQLLDTPESQKQIILLVNKGTEGRNCKSLFAIALYRKPPKIFTLQATTRCLRSIGKNDKKASIFLSKENYKMLDSELKLNFGVDIQGLNSTSKEKQSIPCTIEKRAIISVKKVIKSIIASQQKDFSRYKINFEQYKPQDIYIHTKELGTEYKDKGQQNIETKLLNRVMNYYEILWVIHKYTHIDFTTIKQIFQNIGYEKEQIEQIISDDNKKLFFIIDQIYKHYYEYTEKETSLKEELKLIKVETNSFTFDVDKDHLNLVCYKESLDNKNRLGFHINPYNFDSSDELEIFKHIQKALSDDEAIKDVYFTGGTGNENYTDFFFQYEIYEEEQRRFKKYFPDFLISIEKPDSSKKYLVVEIKGSDKKANYEKAKEYFEKGDTKIVDDVFAKEIGFMEFQKHNPNFEYRIVFDAKVPSEQRKLIEKVKAFE